MIAEPPRRSNHHLINRIRLIEGDIVRQTDVDAIAGSIGPDLKGTGSLNRAILRAAGKEVDNFILENIFKPRSGDVFAIPPFALPVKHILYAVMPVWKDSLGTEDRDLLRCYRGVVEMARRMRLRRIAIPALGSGEERFPVRRVARIGVQGILDRMGPGIEEVRIVCNRRETYLAFGAALKRQGWDSKK